MSYSCRSLSLKMSCARLDSRWRCQLENAAAARTASCPPLAASFTFSVISARYDDGVDMHKKLLRDIVSKLSRSIPKARTWSTARSFLLSCCGWQLRSMAEVSRWHSHIRVVCTVRVLRCAGVPDRWDSSVGTCTHRSYSLLNSLRQVVQAFDTSNATRSTPIGVND